MQGLHKARVTCSKWSLNGMKLFTGDDQGLVVCTEFDAFQVMNIKRVYSVYFGIIIMICRLRMYSLPTINLEIFAVDKFLANLGVLCICKKKFRKN